MRTHCVTVEEDLNDLLNWGDLLVVTFFTFKANSFLLLISQIICGEKQKLNHTRKRVKKKNCLSMHFWNSFLNQNLNMMIFEQVRWGTSEAGSNCSNAVSLESSRRHSDNTYQMCSAQHRNEWHAQIDHKPSVINFKARKRPNPQSKCKKVSESPCSLWFQSLRSVHFSHPQLLRVCDFLFVKLALQVYCCLKHTHTKCIMWVTGYEFFSLFSLDQETYGGDINK